MPDRRGKWRKDAFRSPLLPEGGDHRQRLSILSSFAPTCWVLQAILPCRDCKMRILVAVSVRELTFVGVEFEKTRNLKLVTQNFFVPLHPEIGLRPFKALRAVQCASRVQCCFAAVQCLRLFKWPAAVQKGSFSAKLRKRQSRAQCAPRVQVV